MQQEDIIRLHNIERDSTQLQIEGEFNSLLNILNNKLKSLSLIPNRDKIKLLQTFIDKIDATN